MENEIQDSSDLWDLERYLIERRKKPPQIRRSPVATHQVCGRLLREGQVSKEELRGLSGETEVDSFFC